MTHLAIIAEKCGSKNRALTPILLATDPIEGL
jgi:hypothetical protein